eukprot:1994873-Rhodomonas_salina.2
MFTSAYGPKAKPMDRGMGWMCITPLEDRPQPVVIEHARHPPVIVDILRELALHYPFRGRLAMQPTGGYSKVVNAPGMTGACARVQARYIWNEKVETTCLFLMGKRIEIRGGSYTAPWPGDLIQLHCCVARVSHMGGFRNWADLQRFLYYAESLCSVRANEFESMSGSSPADFENGQGFWVALEFFPVVYENSGEFAPDAGAYGIGERPKSRALEDGNGWWRWAQDGVRVREKEHGSEEGEDGGRDVGDHAVEEQRGVEGCHG